MTTIKEFIGGIESRIFGTFESIKNESKLNRYSGPGDIELLLDGLAVVALNGFHIKRTDDDHSLQSENQKTVN